MALYPKGSFLCVTASFEFDEQAAQFVRFPCRALITKFKVIVTKAIAGDDPAFVTLHNPDGSSWVTATVPLGSALGVEVSADLPANSIVARGASMKVNAVKSTAGGKCQIYIEYQPLGK